MHDNCDCCRGMAALIASGILDTLETEADRRAAEGGAAATDAVEAEAGAAVTAPAAAEANADTKAEADVHANADVTLAGGESPVSRMDDRQTA